MPEVSDPQVPDTGLDARRTRDDDYLKALGYAPQLNRAIGLVSSFAVQFSAIGVITVSYVSLSVGLGYFGPASFWAWVIGGAFQVFLIGLAVAELVSAYPLAGGVYQITNRILAQAKTRFLRAKWIGWQTGWLVVVAHTVSVAAVAYLSLPYVTRWFGVTDLSAIEAMWWALGICALSTLINLAGVRFSAVMNNLGVLAELLAGVLVIGGLLLVRHYTQPASVLVDTAGTASDGAVSAFLFSLLLPLFLIQSFDSTGNAAEETRDAARKAPLGALLANTSAWVLGIIFIGLVYLAIPDVGKAVESSTPGRYILESALGQAFTNVFEAIAVVGLLANAVVVQLTGARVLWALAREGEVPAARALAKVSRQKVPVNATLAVFLVAASIVVVTAASASVFTLLVGLTALAWTLAYAVVVTAGLYAILTNKLPHRAFSVGRLGPVVFLLATIWAWVGCAVVIWQNPIQVGGGILGVIVVGFFLYLASPRRRRAGL